ncbi:hypothetical protein X971_1641 [Agrobacterium tumefaciens LBA4213 (Ach5)]|nr:hypothetical protein X971_1641 [Agrobacterium tumefaciens LBA4213 (Ach5)]
MHAGAHRPRGGKSSPPAAVFRVIVPRGSRRTRFSGRCTTMHGCDSQMFLRVGR